MRFRVYSFASNRQRPSSSKALSSAKVREPRADADRAVSVKRHLLLEQLCQRQVFANVAGLVFEDIDRSWRPEGDEVGLPSRIVFVDSNDNGELDENESLQLTDAAGRFDFNDLSGDESIIRLFSGAPATLPRFPVTANGSAGTIPFAGGPFAAGSSIASVRDDLALAISGSAIQRVDIDAGVSTGIEISALVRAAEWLPDGRILVLATDEAGNHAFTIDANDTVTPIALQSSAPAEGWSDVALDASGNGVLVERSEDATLLRAISVGDSIAVGNTTTTVGAGTRVVSGGELTTVISTPTDDGIHLRLWSNATGTEIGDGGVEISGGQEVLSYDDSSGLVLLRTASDSITLLDAAAGFASLQTLDQIDGPAVLDASRELLFTLSPGDSLLRIIDVNTANTLAQFTLPGESLTSASQIALDSASGKLLVLTAAGIAPITLERTTAHRVRTSSGSPSYDLLFALDPNTTNNTPPRFDELPTLTTAEDAAVVVGSPQLLATASDAEGDRFVVMLSEQAEHGLVVVTATGGFGYVPDADFFGTDRFSVVLHDGRTASEPIELSIDVTPVNDPLILDVLVNAVAENAAENVVAATLQVTDVDGGPIAFSVDDPRFKILNQTVVVASGAQFDHETEQTVSFNVTATNPSTGETASKAVEVPISDVEETIFDIKPDSAFVDENRPGELLAEVFVMDDGEGAQYDFSIDDERFEVLFRDLRLKPGISLDYEAEPTVTVNITATSASGETKTEPIVITVGDIGEQASSIELSREAVVELVRGAVVGDIIVDGNVLGSGYIATVDDTRFEIIGSRLKLRTSEFVRFADQQEIQVVLTVQDASASFLPVAGTFVLDVLPNENPFHNETDPYDVNGDGDVNPLDALLIINSISRNGGPGPISQFPSPDRYYDVNGDGLITALDALLVINYLNRQNRGIAEPESIAVPDVPAAPIAQNDAPAAQRSAAPQIIGPIMPPMPIDQAVNEPVADIVDPAPARKTIAVDTELIKLRDEVLELLKDDHLSDDEDVEAAIDDFLGD